MVLLEFVVHLQKCILFPRWVFFSIFFFFRSYYSKWNMRRTISFSQETLKIWRKCALMHLEWVGTRDCFFWLHDWDWLQASGQIKMFILFVVRPTRMERIPYIFELLVMPADIVEFNCFISTALAFLFSSVFFLFWS